jgi:succinate dehydrogenase / fumarate reductase cytochrome b subunit
VTKSETSFFSRFMIWTGATVLTFLVLHFFNFFFIKIGLVPGNPEDFYTMAHNLFKIPAYNIIYLTSFTILGLHLYHALWSAFQTFGLNHRIWTPVVKILAIIYAIVIPSGFAYISISLWLLR